MAMGEPLGPYHFDDLRKLAADGTLARDGYVRDGADGKWVAAETVDGLFGPAESLIDAVDRVVPPPSEPPPPAVKRFRQLYRRGEPLWDARVTDAGGLVLEHVDSGHTVEVPRERVKVRTRPVGRPDVRNARAVVELVAVVGEEVYFLQGVEPDRPEWAQPLPAAVKEVVLEKSSLFELYRAIAAGLEGIVYFIPVVLAALFVLLAVLLVVLPYHPYYRMDEREGEKAWPVVGFMGVAALVALVPAIRARGALRAGWVARTAAELDPGGPAAWDPDGVYGRACGVLVPLCQWAGIVLAIVGLAGGLAGEVPDASGAGPFAVLLVLIGVIMAVVILAAAAGAVGAAVAALVTLVWGQLAWSRRVVRPRATRLTAVIDSVALVFVAPSVGFAFAIPLIGLITRVLERKPAVAGKGS